MVISSDEDSDVADTENDDDETDADDYLPSIPEIVSRLEKEEPLQRGSRLCCSLSSGRSPKR